MQKFQLAAGKWWGFVLCSHVCSSHRAAYTAAGSSPSIARRRKKWKEQEGVRLRRYKQAEDITTEGPKLRTNSTTLLYENDLGIGTFYFFVIPVLAKPPKVMTGFLERVSFNLFPY